MRFSSVTEDGIGRLVDVFYAKIRADPVLGPIFNGVIAQEAWPAHLATMRAFWSSVMLTTGRYKGNPMLAHLRLKMVRPENFERWLALFAEASTEVFEDAVAIEFQTRAARIARSLSIGMFYHPEDHAPNAKAAADR